MNRVLVRHPDEFVVDSAVAQQADAPVCGWLVVDGKFVAARLELSARRWCAYYPDASVRRVKQLVYMAEYCTSDLGVRSHQIKKRFGISKADSVQPFAVNGQGWVVQANQDMLTVTCVENAAKPLEFLLTNFTGCAARPAAVNADH